MAGSSFVSPTGYVELDNDCQYSIDLKSTRNREYVNPKEDLAFYFNTYLVPKYGLDDINVNNVASFMKELQMNWTKLTPELKDKVLNIMVDDIFNTNYDFKAELLKKIGVENPEMINRSSSEPLVNTSSKSSFGKSNFGEKQDLIYLSVIILFVSILAVVLYKKKVI